MDGLLADLGVSRYQLTEGERGFSLMADGPLDMRMDRSQEQTAADIVNYESEKELADLIFQLGEERRSRRIARAIVRARPITDDRSVGQADRTGRAPYGKTSSRDADVHGAADRGESGERGIGRAARTSIPKLVKPGGRVVVLTFMSLEDRKVKQSFQAMARDGQVKILTRHVVRPSGRRNPGQSAVAPRKTAGGGNFVMRNNRGSIQPQALSSPGAWG